MFESLPSWPLLSAFLAASVVLAVTPGPGVFYIVTRSLAHGRGLGLASVAGVALGNLGCAVAASLGLAAVLAVSSTAFAVIKYAGAVYLLYLGVQALRGARRASRGSACGDAARGGRVIADGFLVALLNPKTALFFGAFLPQFMDAESASVLQSIALGGLFVCIAAVTDSVYALAAGSVAPMLGRSGRAFALGPYLSGGCLVGLGVFTALSGPRKVGG
jgi:threonine/homoserine/homoserine lactone efflux protein